MDQDRIHYADAAKLLGVCHKLILGDYVRRGTLPPPDSVGTFPLAAVEALAEKFNMRRVARSARTIRSGGSSRGL